MVALAMLVGFLVLSGCATGPDPLLQLSNESIALMQQANNRSLTPQERMTMAQRLMAHSSRYDVIIRDRYATRQDQMSALRLKKADADTAAVLMRTIAEDYIANGEMEKGRDMYYLILKTFTGDAYNGTRRSVEAELMHLDEKAHRKASTKPTLVY